ncbi:hypothetical protein ABZ565_04480 [Streptomyces sp. NPDC016469]|uniref:hypothetical protein n=1 Tax=Streptomyces sp. NPDC016469 TaxID=3157191 RepID=UPI0033CBCEA5
MQSIRLPKPLLTAVLGSAVVLTAIGTPNAHATARTSATTAASTPSARTSVIHTTSRASIARTAREATAVTRAGEAEAQFLELADLIAQSCEPKVYRADGHVTSAPTPGPTQPFAADPVALTPAEECAAQRHQLRISKAFSGAETVTYEQMLTGLTALRYPGARIHRMPDFAGKPVSRLDLRVGADHLALEVTDIGHGVMVQAFGAPQGVSVTEVRLKRQLDRPTS